MDQTAERIQENQQQANQTQDREQKKNEPAIPFARRAAQAIERHLQQAGDRAEFNPQDLIRTREAIKKLANLSGEEKTNAQDLINSLETRLNAINQKVRENLILRGYGQEVDLIEKPTTQIQRDIETAGVNSFIAGMLGQEAIEQLGLAPSDAQIEAYINYAATINPQQLMKQGLLAEALAQNTLEQNSRGYITLSETEINNLNRLLDLGQKMKKIAQTKGHLQEERYDQNNVLNKAELLKFMVGNSQRAKEYLKDLGIFEILENHQRGSITEREANEQLQKLFSNKDMDRRLGLIGKIFAGNLSEGGMAALGLLTTQTQMVTDLFGKVGEMARNKLLGKNLPPELAKVLGQNTATRIKEQVEKLLPPKDSNLSLNEQVKLINNISNLIADNLKFGETNSDSFTLANLFTENGASAQAICAVRSYLMATYLQEHFPNVAFTAENQIVGQTGHVRLIALIEGKYYAIDPSQKNPQLEIITEESLPEQIKKELSDPEIREKAFARLNADMMVNFASFTTDYATKLQLLNAALQNDPDNIMALVGLARYYEGTDAERTEIFRTRLKEILNNYTNNNFEDLTPRYEAIFTPVAYQILADKIKTALNNNPTQVPILIVPPNLINIDAGTLAANFTYHDLISLKTALGETMIFMTANPAFAADAVGIANAITAIDTRIGLFTPEERLRFAQNDFWDNVRNFINLPGNKLASDFGSEKYQYAQRLLNIATDIKSNAFTAPKQVEFYAALATILPEMHDVSLHLRTKGFDQAMTIMGKWKNKEILTVFSMPGLQEYFSLFEASLITKIAEETIYSESMIDDIRRELAHIFTQANGYDTKTDRIFHFPPPPPPPPAPIEIPHDIYGDISTYVSDIFFRSAEAISNGKISKTTVANVTGFDIIVQIFNPEGFLVDRYDTVPPAIRPFYEKYLKPIHYVNTAVNYTGFFSGWRTGAIIESLEREMPNNDNLGLSMRYFYISSNYEKYLDGIKRNRKNKSKQIKAEHEFRSKFGIPPGMKIEDFIENRENQLLRKMIAYEPDILATLFLGKIVGNTAGGTSPDAFNSIITGHIAEWRTLADKLRQARALTLDVNFAGFGTLLAAGGAHALTPAEQTLLSNIRNFLNHTDTLAILRDPKSQLKGLHKNPLVNRVYYLGDFPIKVLNGKRLVSDLGEDGIGRESGNLQGAKAATEAIGKTIATFTTKHHLVEQVQELFGKFGYKGSDFEEDYAIAPLVKQILAYEKKDLPYFPDMITDISHLLGLRISSAQRLQARDSTALSKPEMYDELEMLLKASGLSQETVDEIMGQYQLFFLLRNIPVIGDIIFTTFLAIISSLIGSMKG